MQGHALLVTSRPAGVDEGQFDTFLRLSLTPVTEAQQVQYLRQRLGGARSAELVPYLYRLIRDSGGRITSNPLMLSAVASVCELRAGIGMPATVAELYETMSHAMLSLCYGRVKSEQLQLLEAIFFAAHVAEQRIITVAVLDAALLQVPGAAPTTLDELRSSMLHDELPLLKLLQAEPFEVQAIHLSFQEYFAARAISSVDMVCMHTPRFLPQFCHGGKVYSDLGARLVMRLNEGLRN